MILVYVALIACYFLLRKYLLLLWNRGIGELPAGPWTSLPIVGDVLSIDGKKPFETLAKFAEQYGRIYSIMMGGQLTIVLADQQLVRRAFKDERFAGRPRTLFAILEIDEGIVLSDGEKWKEHRRFALQALRDYGFGKTSGEEYIQKEAGDLLAVLKNSGSQPMDNRVCLASASSNVMAYMLFSNGFSSDDKRFQQYIAYEEQNFRDSSSVSALEMFPVLRFFPPFRSGFMKMKDRLKEQLSLLQELIDDHKTNFDSENPRDYIDAFLRVQEGGAQPSFTDHQLLCNVGDLFAASLETTTTFLRWALLLMILHPEAQKKVQAEIDKVIGRARSVAFSDRSSLNYVEATILEIFRVANFGPFLLPHRLMEKVEFEGFILPKDSTVIALQWYINRDPKLWGEDVLDFKPERFLGPDGTIDPNVAGNLSIFSTGKRSCPGELLARMEALIFFASILQNFTILGEEGSSPSMEPVNGLTLSPKLYLMRAIPRK